MGVYPLFLGVQNTQNKWEMLLKRISELCAIRDHQGWCGTTELRRDPQEGAGVSQDGQRYWGARDPSQENTLGSERVSPGSKGAGMQQAGKLTSSLLPRNAEVIHVQTNNSSINNAAAPTS